MASINQKPESTTYEGGPSRVLSKENELKRTVMACLLWEDSYYEDGTSVAERIKKLVPLVSPEVVASIAIEARTKMNLRHAPLLIVREMARHPEHKKLVKHTLYNVINRADELTEFLAIYWKEGRQALSGQIKKGLAAALTKFSADQLSKYNRDGVVKLKDVLFLVHPKPLNDEMQNTWNLLIKDELPSPDTWEVSLSAGEDKKEVFTRLLEEKKLGALALLRNLRNMEAANVSRELITNSIKELNTSKILPFRFIAAAKHAPHLEQSLEEALIKCCSQIEKIPGKTVLMVDVSGSMTEKLSKKSDMDRIDAACGLAIIAREVFEQVEIHTFSEGLATVPARRGFALRDLILSSQPRSGTNLGAAIDTLHKINTEKGLSYDRIIIITDEQTSDRVEAPRGNGYVLNVASYKNGISTNQYTTITGWSDAVIKYISEIEKM